MRRPPIPINGFNRYQPEQGAEVGLPLALPDACLVGRGACGHDIGMFIVTEADAAAIRAVFDQDGPLGLWEETYC